MKPITFGVLCLISIAYGSKQDVVNTIDNWSDLFDRNHKKCVTETEVTEEDATDVFRTLKFPNNHKFKCFIKCQMQNLNFLTSEGEPNTQILIQQAKSVDEKTIKEAWDIASNETDVCAKAYAFVKNGAHSILKELEAQ
ncbi:hypothetical protein FQA39_LY17671 [Lamprigera yunnana]|nr:hypothetical protein FQA39_LY17671 [Lamprigera yunnana]